MTLDRMIINLKIVAEVKIGQKLNTKSDLFSIEDGDLSAISLYRWLRNDGRSHTTRSIMDLIEHSVEMLDKKKINNKADGYLINHLSLSKAGINNLQKSYSNDITIKSSLQRCLDKIDDILSKYNDENIS